MRTSVVDPSQPRFPAAVSIYLQVGSMWMAEMTPALGGPGTIRKGTVECLKAAASLRSYRRRISCDALPDISSISHQQGKKDIPNQVPAIRHSLYSTNRITPQRKLERPLRGSKTFMQAELFNRTIPSSCIDIVPVWRPTSCHAPRWNSTFDGDAGNGVCLSTIPYPECAFI
jgi:hypothetical protein